MNREKLAWAAGFFDGEGCAYVHHVNGGRHAAGRVAVVQAHSEPLLRFVASIGFGRVTGPKPNGYKGMYEVRVGDFEGVQAIACLLWPWLGPLKKLQFKKALLAFREPRQPRGRPRLREEGSR